MAALGGCACRHAVPVGMQCSVLQRSGPRDLLDWPRASGSPSSGLWNAGIAYQGKAFLCPHGHGEKSQHAFVGLGYELTCSHPRGPRERRMLWHRVTSGIASPLGLSLLWPFCLPELFWTYQVHILQFVFGMDKNLLFSSFFKCSCLSFP